MSRAHDLFERIRAGGITAVKEMVADEITEELFLDYKLVSTAHPSHKLSESDRKNLAKAISGFANSDGGIIVWGVNCRPVEGRGDVPASIVNIPNATWFKTLIDGAVSGVTLPPHGGVETIAVTNEAADEGVAATHVPVGFSVPLWSIPDGTKNFYIRAGSNFLPVPHGVLAGLFGKKPQPQLKGEFSLVKLLPQPTFTRATFSLNVMLTNEGRGSAEDAYAIIDMSHGEGVEAHMSSYSTKQWYARQKASIGRFTLISTTQFSRVPPNDSVGVTTIQVIIQRPMNGDLVFSGTCGSSDSPGSSFNLTVPARTLNRVHELLTHKFADQSDQERCLHEATELFRHPIH